MEQTTSPLGRVRTLARRISRAVGRESFEEELSCEGNLAVAEAGSRFRPELGLGFWTFAYPRVRGRMLDHLVKALKAERGMSFHDHEGYCGTRTTRAVRSPLAAQANSGGGSDGDGFDPCLGAEVVDFELYVQRRRVSETLGRLLADMPPSELAVVRLVDIEEETLRGASRLLGMPVWKVDTLRKRAHRRLRRGLGLEGFDGRGLTAN